MKYLLIVGTQSAGKSNTINAVCTQLNPSKVMRLNLVEKICIDVDISEELLNGTYIIEVAGKLILVVAGTPTEQETQITVIIQICVELTLKIDLAIVAMRTFERKPGFSTRAELEKLGVSISEEWIENLGEHYKETDIWKERINRITKLIKENL